MLSSFSKENLVLVGVFLDSGVNTSQSSCEGQEWYGANILGGPGSPGPPRIATVLALDLGLVLSTTLPFLTSPGNGR